jgi:hypothetical protein
MGFRRRPFDTLRGYGVTSRRDKTASQVAQSAERIRG